MSLLEQTRPFTPGTTGWTARDLDDPAIERQWFAGQYEIVEGVLTLMPPAYFAGSSALFQLMMLVYRHVEVRGPRGRFATELDIVIDEARVARADAAFLTEQDQARQADAAGRAGRSDPQRTRILIPPTLVIESLSPGHEAHDQRTKRRWYAEFRVPHYWLLDAYQRTLECLVLENAQYHPDAAGRDDQPLHSTLFPGLTLPLAQLWPPVTNP